MNKVPRLLGVDPGMANMGLCLVALHRTHEEPIEFRILRTEKSAKKSAIYASADNDRRCRELVAGLEDIFDDAILAICAESQSWPRNAANSAKVGMAWGVLSAVAEISRIPILQASPQAIKKRLTGKKTATKEMVQIALVERYPDMPPWPKQKTLIEHAADALGAVVACLDSDLVTMARKMCANSQKERIHDKVQI